MVSRKALAEATSLEKENTLETAVFVASETSTSAEAMFLSAAILEPEKEKVFRIVMTLSPVRLTM